MNTGKPVIWGVGMKKMTKDLKNASREELGKLFPIILSDHKPEWFKLFIEERNYLISILGDDTVLRVEHIGSTAVPNLISKPTIDLLVEIPNDNELREKIKNILVPPEYHFMHDQIDHLMFVKGYTPEGFKGQCYHIHVDSKENDSLWDRIYFRDYLISNPSIASEYSKLKQRLYLEYKNDREAYTEGKTEFIQKITIDAKKQHRNNLNTQSGSRGF